MHWDYVADTDETFIISNGGTDVAFVDAPPSSGDTLTWTMTGLEPNQYMCFHIQAENQFGKSAWTPYECDTTLPPV